MLNVESIQKRLSGVTCPPCRNSGFLVRESDRQSFMEKFCQAQCTSCAYNFPVTIPTRPVAETDPDTHQWLSGLPCPSCQKNGAGLDFRCRLSVRESLYFLTCNTCRHTFHEKAPMEAFE